MTYTYKVAKYFAEKNLPPLFNSFNEDIIPNEELQKDLNSIDDDYAIKLFKNKKPKNWNALTLGTETPEEKFDLWKRYILLKEIEKEINGELIKTLCNCKNQNKCKPYDEPDLNGLNIDEECLVNLKEFSQFEIDNKIKGKYSICLPIRDSMLNERIYLSFMRLSKKQRKNIKIRLDPLFRNPIFTSSFERLYGEKINWEELTKTKKSIKAPYENKYTNIKTEIYWRKNGDKLLFTCEELPPINKTTQQVTRFYHAIYDSQKGKIEHLDASAKIYDYEDYSKRISQNLWNDGSKKLGDYYKIYGLYMTTEQDEELGLFKNLNGTVKNLYLENTLIYGASQTAALASSANNSIIENVSVKGNIIGKNSKD